MGEIVVSSFLRVLLVRMKSSDDDDQILSRNELKHLVTSLQRLAEAVEVAEKLHTNDSRLESWLLQVESVLFDIDDMLDEVKMRGAALFKPHSKLAETYKIKTIRRALDDIDRGWGSAMIIRRFQPLISSDPDEPVSVSMVGRESDKSRIIDLILASADKYWNVSVFPIVGFMGIGKTALAQSIYLDSRIRGNFDVRLWVRLAGEVPDIFDILKQVVMMATQDQDPVGPSTLQADMKREVSELLRHRKLLIVLDDCREDHLRLPLTRELVDVIPGGSAIIVTTRSERVASMVGTTPAYQLERLSLDDSYELFKRASNHAGNLNAVATEILKLCKGIPSVVEAIGRFLSSKRDPEQWERELSRLQDGNGKGIVPYFAFDCWDRLPSYLKHLIWTFHLQTRCRLTVDELICLWMGLGFLSSCDLDDPTQHPEHIARKYLKEFAKYDLFSNVEYAPGGFISDITLDDVAYDLATYKARNQVQVYGHSTRTHYSFTARYSIWDTDHLPGQTLPSSLPNANKTRLFMLCHGRQASEQLVKDIVSGFKCLRVLGLAGSDIKMLPDSIGSLKHLRYLDVGRNARMKMLPDSICKLWNLQTLLLNGCDQLQQIPEGIGKLQNLRYLTLTTLQGSLPEQIGQLCSLQTLGLAKCPRLISLPRSIKNLKSLQTLGIVDCQVFDLGISSVDSLKWVNGGTLLLSGLPKLERFPSALGHASVSLKHLMIQSCERLTDTIWIQHLRSLCSLTIEDCPNLSNFADGTRQFYNVVELVIRGCRSLANTTWIKQFISLRSLVIDACPNIVELDDGFAGLKYLERLEIRKCPDLTNGCVAPAGKDWPLIAHVLVIELD